MPITYKKTVALLEEMCDVEDAQTLLEWFYEHPKGMVNLKKCSHVHSAVLQVLMALQPAITVEPEDGALAAWLLPAIASNRSTL